MLTYTLITDPAPLEASAAGRPSTGTVYLTITNAGQQAAYWSTIEVEVPVGNGAGHLTSDINKIKAKGEHNGTPSVNVQQQGSNAFRATAPASGRRFAPGDYVVLTLENVTVAASAGLAVLKVTEATGRSATGRLSRSVTMVPLVKTAPKEIPAPRDFHPNSAMVDAGTNITLRWQGSADFRYEIMYPGAPQSVSVSGDTWSPPDAPKRATTYVLIATDPNTQQQHFLTTTVQVRNPILETLTVAKGVTTPWVQGPTKDDGAFTFSKGAMHVWREFGSQEAGALYAGEAVVSGVATEYVKGLKDGDGDITFLQGGVKVWRTRGSNDPGTLYASGIRTDYVSGPNDGDGDIRFLQGGMKIWSALGSNDPGTLYAGKAKLNGVASGQTIPGWGWKAYGPNSVYIDIDTSAAGFTGNPIYLTAIGGVGGMQYDLVGTSAVYDVTATKFSVYLKWRDDRPLSVADAQRFGWYINWIGYDTP
ncbi:hypothetical protein GCM10027187_65060 [Streptosporangium sandarakinum]